MISSFYTKSDGGYGDKSKHTKTNESTKHDHTVKKNASGTHKSKSKPAVTNIDDECVDEGACISTTKTWTTEDFTRMKNSIPNLEEYQILQIIHFLLMDNVSHTKTKDGIMLNLSSAPNSFLVKLDSFLDKSERDRKYRDI